MNRCWRADAESMRPWFRTRFEPAAPEPSPGLAQGRGLGYPAESSKQNQTNPSPTK